MSLNRAVRFTAGLVFGAPAHRRRGRDRPGIGGSPESQRRRSSVPEADLIAILAVVLLGTLLAAVGDYRIIAPSLRWFDAGLEPDVRSVARRST